MKSAISADALNGWSPNPSVLALAFRALLGTYLFRYHLSKLFARVSYERVLEVQRTIFLLLERKSALKSLLKGHCVTT